MNNSRLRGTDRKMTQILPNIHAGTAACVIVDILLFLFSFLIVSSIVLLIHTCKHMKANS